MEELFINEINKCIEVLRRGGIIIYPTDTVWGIGCDATDSEAVKKIFEIKHRSDSKALITLVDSVAALERVVPDIPEVAYQLIDVAVDPMTIVYDNASGVAPEVIASDGSIGVRLTRERFSAELCRRLRHPLVSTSVNVSGEPAPKSFAEIDSALLSAVDHVCEWGRELPWASKPSTVIKLSAGGVIKFLRK